MDKTGENVVNSAQIIRDKLNQRKSELSSITRNKMDKRELPANRIAVLTGQIKDLENILRKFWN